MTTDATTPATLHTALDAIRRAPLSGIPSAAAAKVVRRVVDRKALAPKLDVAAFNSAP